MKNPEDLLNELESMTKDAPDLTPQMNMHLKSMYGVPISSIKLQKFDQPPSPGTSLANAGEYLKKQAGKGLVDPIEANKDFHPHLMSNLAKNTQNMTVTEHNNTDIKRLFEKEPHQRFWLTSKSVSEVTEELRNLPYKDPRDAIFYQSRFLDLAANIVRYMHHSKMLETKNSKRSVLKKNMRYFIDQTADARKEVIRSAFSSARIDKSKIPKAYIEEFPDIFPASVDHQQPRHLKPQQATKNVNSSELESRMLDIISGGSSTFPSAYKYKPNEEMTYSFDRVSFVVKESLKVTEKKNQDQPSPSSPQPKIFKPIVLSRPFTNNKETSTIGTSQPNKPRRISLTDIHSTFWDFDDPLNGKRSGSMLNMLEDIRKSGPEPEVYQYHETIKEEEGQDLLKDISPPTMPVKQYIHRKKNKPMQPLKESKDELPTAKSLTQFIEQSQTSDAMKYLLSQNILVGPDDNDNDHTSSKLNQIWDKLGFTAQQKIALVVKYSKSAEESSKLTEALGYWDSALQVVTQYEEAYRKLRDFFRFEVQLSKDSRMECLMYYDSLNLAEARVQQITGILSKNFGDDLVIKGKKAVDLIAKRRKKLDLLQKEIESAKE